MGRKRTFSRSEERRVAGLRLRRNSRLLRALIRRVRAVHVEVGVRAEAAADWLRASPRRAPLLLRDANLIVLRARLVRTTRQAGARPTIAVSCCRLLDAGPSLAGTCP